jgi:hypothetical protein
VSRADRDEVVTLRLAAVHADGTPRAAAPIAIEATHGTVGALEETAPGTYRARWRLPPGPAVEARATAPARGQSPGSRAPSRSRDRQGPPRAWR